MAYQNPACYQQQRKSSKFKDCIRRKNIQNNAPASSKQKIHIKLHFSMQKPYQKAEPEKQLDVFNDLEI